MLMGTSQQRGENRSCRRDGGSPKEQSTWESERKQEPEPKSRGDLRNFFHCRGGKAAYRGIDAGRKWWWEDEGIPFWLQSIFLKCEVRSLVWELGKESAGGFRRKYKKVALVQILLTKCSWVVGSVECLRFKDINVKWVQLAWLCDFFLQQYSALQIQTWSAKKLGLTKISVLSDEYKERTKKQGNRTLENEI